MITRDVGRLRRWARVLEVAAFVGFVVGSCGAPAAPGRMPPEPAGVASPTAVAQAPVAADQSLTTGASTLDEGNSDVTDQPCSTLATSITDLPVVPLHHEDLERMVPARAEIPGLETFTDDYLNWGYVDNAEVTWIAPNPPTTCDDTARFERLEGYVTSYSSEAAPGRVSMFAVHLFRAEEGATAWATAFRNGLLAGAGVPAADYTFRAVEPWSGGLGIDLWEHTGPDGTRTWAMLRSGPILGWVIDLHPSGEGPTIDVLDAAARMAVLIEARRAAAAKESRHGLDVAQLIAGPLPRAAYGEVGTGLEWDPFFGACQDNVERGLIAGEEAEALARRLGRVTGCVAMYSPSGPGGDVVRVFSAVTIYPDADHARASVDALVTDYVGRGGRSFPVDGIGEVAAGLVTPFPAEADGKAFTDTRVAFTLGEIAAVVVIDRVQATPEDQLRTLARGFEQRLRSILERN